METDVKDAIREIWRMNGEISVSLILNGCADDKELSELGYTISSGCYGEKKLEKKGLIFPIWYLSDSRWHLSNGFYFGKNKERKFCAYCDIPKKIGEIVAQGFVPEYKRSEETQKLSDFILSKIKETDAIVSDARSSLLGGALRYRGYFVSYDGYSVCSFTKDGIMYHADAVGSGRWRLTNGFNVYVANGKPSDGFSIGKGKLGTDYIEGVVGNLTELGRRLTEKDLLPTYKRFRVRTYGEKELKTIKWFDDFESAKKYAYDYAVEQAKKVEPRYRRWAHNPPLDWSERNDYLALYVWYKHDNGSPYAVFVQGEHE